MARDPVRVRTPRRLSVLVFAGGMVALAALPALARAQYPAAGSRLPENDNAIFSMTRLELDATRSGGRAVGSWTGEGWIGTDANRIWWSTEGERVGNAVVDANVRAMYGHYFAHFWDAVIGYNRDVEPVGVNYLTAGVRGLAPYWFDLDAVLLMSDRAKLSARTDVGTDWLLTQRLILHPELRLDWPLMPDLRRGLTPGVGDARMDVAARYEFRREFAPYVDLRWTRDAGAARTAQRAGGPDITGWTVRGGMRLMF